MTRVGIDVFGTNRDRVTGWERYARGLADALSAVSNSQGDVSVVEIGDRPVSKSRVLRAVGALDHLARRTRQEVKAQKLDVYHATTYPPGRVPGNTRIVWTVHDDLILGGHREYARPGAALWVPVARSRLDHVDTIVTFTQTVRAELVRRGVLDHKIAVIAPSAPALAWPSGPPAVTDPEGRATTLPSQFVLCVGTLEPRKRTDLVAAIARTAGLPVLFVGYQPSALDVSAYGPDSYFAGAASDAQLAWCYEHALALVSASSYEGVNLPIFEALNAGLPVAASNIPVHAELGASAVTLFDGYSVTDGARALERAAGTSSRTPVRLLSTFEEAAAKYLELYRSLV